MNDLNAATEFDRSQPPAQRTPRQFQLAPFERSTEGGLEILVLPRTDFPIVSLSLIATAAGAENQPRNRSGLASLAAAALTEGTSSRSAVEFHRSAEALGGFVSSGADWEATAVHAGSLSEHLDSTFGLACDAYLDAAFHDDDIERLRSRRLSELARRDEDPGSIAGKELIRRLYGRSVHYGTPLIGERESLEITSAVEVADHWRRNRMVASLVVAGNVEPEHVFRLAAERLRTVSQSEGRATLSSPGGFTSEAELPQRSAIEVHIMDRPQAAQTQVLMGHVGPIRMHPDRAKLRLLNAIFGGKFSSRINLNLREVHGFTYGANSSFSARRGPGPFAIQAAIENQHVGAAVEQVLLELRRIRTEPIEKTELEDARSYLLGVQPYGFQTLEGWLSALGSLAVFDLPTDWYEQQQLALTRVTSADLLQVANEHLHPERLVVVAVGPAEQIARQFGAEFGAVEVHTLDD